MTPEPQKQDHLLDHQYDGIQEYDNPMPRWWVWIFYATILFSVVYFLNVPGIGTGRGRIANYERDMAAAAAKRAALEASRPHPAVVTNASMLATAHDPKVLELGKQVFTTNCVACHREDGGGNIGPNLTDDFWIHGGAPAQFHGTIERGVLEKGMPAWGQILKPEEITAVAAYVLTLHHTHPKDPKAPQGDHYDRDDAKLATDDAGENAGGQPH